MVVVAVVVEVVVVFVWGCGGVPCATQKRPQLTRFWKYR